MILNLPLPLTLFTLYNMFLLLIHHASFQNTYPSHLNQFLLTSSDISSIPIQSLSSTLVTLSLRDTPHIHCSILISVCSNCPVCSAFMAEVSLLYAIAFFTHITYVFLFNFNETSFLIKIPDSSLNILHAQHTLANDAEFTVPPPLRISPN